MTQCPVLQGEIVGRRAWRVSGIHSHDLHALVQGDVWYPGTKVARCLIPAAGVPALHTSPDHHCTCGLYAYYDIDPKSLTVIRRIHGLITAWGDVEFHSDGFRAQRARVAALVLEVALPDADPSTGLPRRLARRYGVPLITAHQFFDDSFIAEFGEVVPLELRQWWDDPPDRPSSPPSTKESL